MKESTRITIADDAIAHRTQEAEVAELRQQVLVLKAENAALKSQVENLEEANTQLIGYKDSPVIPTRPITDGDRMEEPTRFGELIEEGIYGYHFDISMATDGAYQIAALKARIAGVAQTPFDGSMGDTQEVLDKLPKFSRSSPPRLHIQVWIENIR